MKAHCYTHAALMEFFPSEIFVNKPMYSHYFLFQNKTELTKYLLHPVLLYLPRVSSIGVLFAAHAGLTTMSEGSVPC